MESTAAVTGHAANYTRREPPRRSFMRGRLAGGTEISLTAKQARDNKASLWTCWFSGPLEATQG